MTWYIFPCESFTQENYNYATLIDGNIGSCCSHILLDSMSSSEKKKIPSLLDLEIYPPGMEPKITGPNFLSRGSYKRLDDVILV